MQYAKHFELEEARELIPNLKQKLIVINNLSLLLKNVGFDINSGRYRVGFHPCTFLEFPPAYTKMLSIIENIFNLGIEIKGIEQGLIDFPAIRENGEEVFLCWKMDEDDITYWHGLYDGFMGRHHIKEF